MLNKYRKNLKIANWILEDTPKVKEVIKIEMQMKNWQEDITKTKKKDRNARQKNKGCYNKDNSLQLFIRKYQ